MIDIDLYSDCYFIISGIDLLSQRFLIELLTIKGSIKYMPDRGCHFINRIKKAQNEYDIIVAFEASKSTIKKNLLKDTGISGDIYLNAKIESIYISDNELYININVTDRLNKSSTIMTPNLREFYDN